MARRNLSDLLTLNEAAEEFGIGYQTLYAAAKRERDKRGTGLRVAKWAKRGKTESPLLVLRADVEAYKANRRTRTGRKSFDKAAQTLGLDERTAERLWQLKQAGKAYTVKVEEKA